MTKEEWLKAFDDTKDEFKWFFVRYFPNMWESLQGLRNAENIGAMFSLMNNVWFLLPDNQFNIMQNPKGWNEFLALLEAEVEVKNG